MGVVEMYMPRMGESVMEGTILQWLKQEGDEIAPEEPVLEIATDKVDTEVPAPFGGVLHEILAKEGDIIQVGSPIALIQQEVSESGESSSGPSQPQKTAENKKEQASVQSVETSSVTSSKPENESGSEVIPEEPHKDFGSIKSKKGRFFSPLVRNVALKEGLSVDELDRIPGSGKDNRLTKHDLLNYLKTRTSTKEMAETLGEQIDLKNRKPSIQPVINDGDEVVQMNRMRKLIAERMLETQQISAHVTSFVEADVTDIVNWRNRKKHEYKEKEGVSLTLTPIFIEAVVKALKDYPMVNVQVDGDRIIKKKSINVGMAVALKDGNLIVPVVKNAENFNLIGLTKEVNSLARKARDNKLTGDDLKDGTYSVSNMGTFGNVMGTPLINQPQVAIMAFGAVEKKPSVIETPQGDAIAIRHKMILSHSYDHRVVDGALGGMFVRRVADYLEKFDTTREL